MADPVLTDFYRVQTILHGRSGLPEDVYVNSWCFRNDTVGGSADAFATLVADRMFAFFDEIPTGGSVPPRTFLSDHTLLPQLTVKVYDLGQPPPRTPHERNFTLGVMSGTQPFPSEVALCLSFYAERNLPRSRGRIYFGPLSISSGTDVTAEISRPTSVIRSTLALAATDLAAEGAGGPNWHVLSQVDAAAKEITGGWVDNAWDTQRRRGEAPDSRTLWGALPS